MELEDVNAGIWYSARKVNNHYIDLLENKCKLEEQAQKHSDYLGDNLEEYFKNKYKETIFVNAKNCMNSLSRLSCNDLSILAASDIESSTFACTTTFSTNNMESCISFNYYFTNRIEDICENGNELAQEHLTKWDMGHFYCLTQYNNSVADKESFPPRDICMSKILNLDCEDIVDNYIGKNIEEKLDCYIDGRED